MAENERRGFAGMDQEKQRQIARKGGKAAHEKGTAHEFTPEEAREAGRKGGEAVSRDREHMSRIGREGGLSSRGGQGRNDSGHGARVHATSGGADEGDSGDAEHAGGGGT
jgi:uncharacterized protein